MCLRLTRLLVPALLDEVRGGVRGVADEHLVPFVDDLATMSSVLEPS